MGLWPIAPYIRPWLHICVIYPYNLQSYLISNYPSANATAYLYTLFESNEQYFKFMGEACRKT